MIPRPALGPLYAGGSSILTIAVLLAVKEGAIAAEISTVIVDPGLTPTLCDGTRLHQLCATSPPIPEADIKGIERVAEVTDTSRRDLPG